MYAASMARLTCDFFSPVLGLSTSFVAVVPQAEAPHTPRRWPVLYLLHGLSDDHTTWTRRTSIERYAEAYNLAVVMPAVGRSFYTDMARGLPYWTFVSRELPQIARSLLPLSDKREETYVAGLSMGGYGAYRLALSNPGMFAAAGSFSGALDMATEADGDDPAWRAEMSNIFGAPHALAGSAHDLLALASRLGPAERKSLRLYQCCGTEDFLYGVNVRFRDHARSLGLDHTYEEEPGVHEWGYWDLKVRHFLRWLFGR
jgi:S-formylglutathione hydrolase FrmB